MEWETEEDLVENVDDREELDLGGTKECMEWETEEDLVEDMEDGESWILETPRSVWSWKQKKTWLKMWRTG